MVISEKKIKINSLSLSYRMRWKISNGKKWNVIALILFPNVAFYISFLTRRTTVEHPGHHRSWERYCLKSMTGFLRNFLCLLRSSKLNCKGFSWKVLLLTSNFWRRFSDFRLLYNISLQDLWCYWVHTSRSTCYQFYNELSDFLFIALWNATP